MAQLVVSGNRILAHGDDCFLATGGTVICTETGRKFENATVVTHNGALPFDIGEVGYEYHAGAFVPCAPFGKGDGNIAVVCGNDCKAIKDSGKSLQHFMCCAELTYTGTGTSYVNNSVTVDFTPLFAIITKSGGAKYDSINKKMVGSGKEAYAVLSRSGAHCIYYNGSEIKNIGLNATFGENSIEWNCFINGTYYGQDLLAQCNEAGEEYTVLVFGN